MTGDAAFHDVVIRDTPYRFSLRQGLHPDGTLKQGTRVQVISKNIGDDVLVDAENGLRVYIDQNDLKSMNPSKT
jgi:hypothetical protein